MRACLSVVLSSEQIAEALFRLVLHAPEVFEQPVQPGQFAQIKLPHAPDRLLRRPISLMSADEERKTLTLGICPKGEGTRLLCAVRPGDRLDLLAPLGKGFVPGDAETLWLVGGGVGAAPMLYAAEVFSKQAQVFSFLGFRTKAQAYALTEFSRCGETLLCTDDGSAGAHGTVLDLMRARLETDGRPGRIMACGPAPMLRAVQSFCLEQQISGQLSLEQRMGCGYGACLTCVCAVKKEDGSTGYDRVCADGPVFDAEEVVL